LHLFTSCWPLTVASRGHELLCVFDNQVDFRLGQVVYLNFLWNA
jgi:hypothetical protein